MNLGGTVKVNKVGVCIVTACFLLLFVYIFIGHSDDTNSKLLSLPEDEESRVNMKSLLIASKEVWHSNNNSRERVFEILGFSANIYRLPRREVSRSLLSKRREVYTSRAKGKRKKASLIQSRMQTSARIALCTTDFKRNSRI